jgi:hypothetical protein
MKKLIKYLNSKEFSEIISPKDSEYTAGMDIADSIALAIICGLILAVFFL